MVTKTIEDLFPYFKHSKRINIFLRERTKFFPHCKNLNKKSTEELIDLLNSLEKNIESLNICMSKHSKRILTLDTPGVVQREIINFIVEAEMKRLCLIEIKKIKHILKNQRKITKYVKKIKTK